MLLKFLIATTVIVLIARTRISGVQRLRQAHTVMSAGEVVEVGGLRQGGGGFQVQGGQGPGQVEGGSFGRGGFHGRGQGSGFRVQGEKGRALRTRPGRWFYEALTS